MSLLNLAEIPGYADAVRSEREARDLAFCDWPVPLCGLNVHQFTLTHLLILGNCENAFVTGGKAPEVEDVAFFLWVVSPDYVPNDNAARNRFLRSIRRKVKFFAAVREIGEYVQAAFQDAPQGGAGETKSYTSFAATYCDLFASEYGWDDSQTMRKPIARLFQLYRRIQKRANPRAILFNQSDRVLSRHLASQMTQPNG